MILTKEFRFEASHQLPWHKGKCARLHGHSWKLTVAVEGYKQPDNSPIVEIRGMVQDYAVLKDFIQPLVDAYLDHYHLNNILENPTSENVLIWIAKQIPEWEPWIELHLEETCTTSCVLTRDDYETNYKERSHHAIYKETKDTETKETPRRSKDSQTPQGNTQIETLGQKNLSDDDIPF